MKKGNLDQKNIIFEGKELKKTFFPLSRLPFFPADPKSGNPVLCGVSITIRSSEICVLLGRNGSGKTTLLKICAGSLIPDSGEVGRQTQKSQISTIASDGFYPRLTGIQNLNFFAALFGVAPLAIRSRVQELNRFFPVDSILETQFQLLSNGQKKLLSIVAALLSRPKLFLLDEVTQGMDPAIQRGVLDCFRETVLNGENSPGVLWVTHNLDEALEIGDRVLGLKSGKMVLGGRSSDLSKKKIQEALF